MDIVEGIRKHGFRKWYERQLIEAHAWLITGFLLLILSFALFEVHNVTAGYRERFTLMAAALAAFAACLFTWWRYRRLLFDTEAAAERANCPHCGTAGRLTIVRLNPHPSMEGNSVPVDDPPVLTVRCRQCQGEWAIDPPAGV